MQTLPLFPIAPKQGIEYVAPLDVTPDCTRCKLHDGVKTVCIPPEGTPGGLLVLSDFPTVKEDQQGRPLAAQAGQDFRRMLRKLWNGPIAIDHALRCAPKGRQLRDTHFTGCAPYTAQTIDMVQPERIIALGNQAIFAITGRKTQAASIRRGYGFLSDKTPIFYMISPAAAKKNRFLQQWFEKDLKWALTCDIDDLRAKLPWEHTYHLVETEEDARVAYETLRQSEFITFDTETAGPMFEIDGLEEEPHFRVRCVAVTALDTEETFVWGDDVASDRGARKYLKLLLEDPSIKKIGQNAKYDINAVDCALLIKPKGIAYDPRLMRKLDWSEADSDLETMQELIGLGGGKAETLRELDRVVKLCKRRKKKSETEEEHQAELAKIGDLQLVDGVRRNTGLSDQKRYLFGLTAPELTWRYCALDALSTGRVATHLIEQLHSTGQLDEGGVWDDLIRPAIDTVAQVERWGLPVDRDAIDAFDTLLGLQIQALDFEIETQIKELYGEEVELGKGKGQINLNSGPQLAKILFRDLKLKPPPNTQTESGQQSLDADVMAAMERQHPIVGALVKRKKLETLQGKYARGLRPYIRSDGRIHCTINLDGARSARTSSSDPNLQNIPRADTEMGKACRSVFRALIGWEFWDFDLSQVELRVACLLSGDPLMLEIFLSGDDYHLRTAKLICGAMGVPLRDLEYDKPDAEELELGRYHPLRTKAKTINFGVLYGQGPGALAATLGIAKAEAKKLMDLIMGKFKVLAAWCKKQIMEVRRTGVVWTWWNGNAKYRKRDLINIVADGDDDAERKKKSVAEHGSYNSPIQGTSSEFLVHIMNAVVAWIKEVGAAAQVCMPIHDSLLMHVRKDWAERVHRKVIEIFQSFNSGPVPMIADAKKGEVWSEMRKVKLPKAA